MALILYGIKNCDTVKKARRWLDDEKIDYRFHDFRADGLDATTVQRWLTMEDWTTVVNRRSTTWKTLDVSERDSMNEVSAAEAVLAAPTLVKRPVLDDGQNLTFGFKSDVYSELFKV